MTSHLQQFTVFWFQYLEAVEVCRFEVIGRTSAPVYDVLVLTLAAQFAIPVGDAKVVVHHAATVGAVLQHCVEEGLEKKSGVKIGRIKQQAI